MNNNSDLKPFVLDDATYATRFTKKFTLRKKYSAPDPKKVLAHIPGVIQKIYVRQGQGVKWGDQLLVLEAMKMKNDLTAPADGTIKSIRVKLGQMVAKNELLLEFE